MTRLARLWVAAAAFATAALLTVAAVMLAPVILRVAFADHEKWWWPAAIIGTLLLVAVLPLKVAGYLRRVGRGPQPAA